MRKVKNPTDSSAFLGQKMIFKKMKRQVLVTNRPDYEVDGATGKQEEVQRKFRKAVHYANLQLADEGSRERYEKRISKKKKTARAVAITDYLTPPRVIEIKTGKYAGSVGNIIRVEADDDFMVASVTVAITASDGTLLESGEAKQDPGQLLDWIYVATVANPALGGTRITATAFDRPGNEAKLEKVL
jgi:hypothetical protein